MRSEKHEMHKEREGERQRPCSAGCFLAYKPAVADLLREKNTVTRLISRADKLSRTGGQIEMYEKRERCFNQLRQILN
jgi:hypothetical protein